ncbi:Lrp/AsnC family transcriptional regulator [Vineibacter terrae]|uniref:Lrp/AsnC family transcriptional regulator n=1 Tax=Vineibacter terrae TaxID=2586908 RepID=UPI002E324B4D|nr:Lrp/AsnC family transcriptional regulator [Vineibacter terrae]HEX2887694.1 Lrp/AsnC family transcriptional regulator [Vineibacter terrae]
MPDLDAIDHRIIAELQRDGRLPIVELADRVGLSATPCLRRVKRLEADGVIMRYAALVDTRRLGRGVQALVEVTLEDHSEAVVEAFEAAIRDRPEVVACFAMTGEMDFLMLVQVADLEAYSTFALRTLLRMPGVKGSRSSFIMQTIKSDLAYAPMPPARERHPP